MGFFDFSIVRSAIAGCRLATSRDFERKERKPQLSFALDGPTQSDLVRCVPFWFLYVHVPCITYMYICVFVCLCSVWSFHNIMCVHTNLKCSFARSLFRCAPVFILCCCCWYIEIDLCERFFYNQFVSYEVYMNVVFIDGLSFYRTATATTTTAISHLYLYSVPKNRKLIYDAVPNGVYLYIAKHWKMFIDSNFQSADRLKANVSFDTFEVLFLT